MGKNYIVSIWIGKSQTEDDFKEYVDEQYSDEGELTSTFMKEFKIDFYDDQFTEMLFKDSDEKKNIFKDFSYSENFMDKIPNKNWNEFNSYILLFNFEYDETIVNTDKFIFMGSFDYR